MISIVNGRRHPGTGIEADHIDLDLRQFRHSGRDPRHAQQPAARCDAELDDRVFFDAVLLGLVRRVANAERIGAALEPVELDLGPNVADGRDKGRQGDDMKRFGECIVKMMAPELGIDKRLDYEGTSKNGGSLRPGLRAMGIPKHVFCELLHPYRGGRNEWLAAVSGGGRLPRRDVEWAPIVDLVDGRI